MYFARIITAAISCAALFQGAAAASIEPRAEHSTAKPVNVDHKVVKEMGQAAGLVQQSYCNDQKYDVGLKVGDAELLWKHGHGDWFQHVLIWKSDSLGIAVPTRVPMCRRSSLLRMMLLQTMSSLTSATRTVCQRMSAL